MDAFTRRTGIHPKVEPIFRRIRHQILSPQRRDKEVAVEGVKSKLNSNRVLNPQGVQSHFYHTHHTSQV